MTKNRIISLGATVAPSGSFHAMNSNNSMQNVGLESTDDKSYSKSQFVRFSFVYYKNDKEWHYKL